MLVRADGGRAAGARRVLLEASPAASTACARSRPSPRRRRRPPAPHDPLPARGTPAPRDGLRGPGRAPGRHRSLRHWAAAAARRRAGRRRLYSRVDVAAGAAGLAERLRALLAGVALPAVRAPHRRRRSSSPARPGAVGHDAVHVPARAAGGLVEDEVLRGLHPMMSHRLRLARLSEFALERLPSAEDVYLFHGVARTNPKDERLFALAEVRDLTRARRRRAGRRAARARAHARRRRSRRSAASRPTASRAAGCSGTASLLHVWPMIDLTPGEIRALVSRLAPVDDRPRRRDAARPGPAARGRRHGARARAALLRAGRAGRRRRGRRSAERAAAAARRGRAADDRRAAPRPAAPGRDRQAARPARGASRGARTAGRRVRRARPRRRRAARCRSTARRRRTRRASSSA